MIKRIKGSLFAKVFILTVAVLLCVSFLVYGVLAWYMPQTYSNNLNAALDEQTSDFIYELEHIRMQDSGGLIDQILQNTGKINGEGCIQLYSVRVHETATGYAEAFREDLKLVHFQIEDILFSSGVTDDWKVLKKTGSKQKNLFILSFK